MEITRGKLASAQKIVLYGPEGIGKSTFAAHAPDPLYIDTEGSTKQLDVARLPRPTSWRMLLDEVEAVIRQPGLCRTLVVDTADWAELLCIEAVCAQYKKTGIEDFGYGKGYQFVMEEFARLLHRLDDVVAGGVHVLLTAHARTRKFEQPDQADAYDRWELKLSKQVAPLVKEWADMVLFANYKTYAVKTDSGKVKAEGGRRVLYTSHHPCWDAKNRHGLPEQIDLDFAAIAPALGLTPAPPSGQPSGQPTSQPVSQPPASDPAPVSAAAPVAAPAPALVTPPDPPESGQWERYDGIPPRLVDLMREAEVTPHELQLVVADKGYYPVDTPVANYDLGFIDGWVLSVWPQIVETIRKNRVFPA